MTKRVKKRIVRNLRKYCGCKFGVWHIAKKLVDCDFDFIDDGILKRNGIVLVFVDNGDDFKDFFGIYSGKKKALFHVDLNSGRFDRIDDDILLDKVRKICSNY